MEFPGQESRMAGLWFEPLQQNIVGIWMPKKTAAPLALLLAA
jgi:hypothetical protein